MIGRLNADPDPTIDFERIYPPTSLERTDVTLLVCAHANDVAEAHLFLRMLGLEENA